MISLNAIQKFTGSVELDCMSTLWLVAERVTSCRNPYETAMNCFSESCQMGSSPVNDVTGFGFMKIVGNCQQGLSKAMKPRVLRRKGVSNEYLKERKNNNLCLEICRYNAVTN
jgi:hypothetical protein